MTTGALSEASPSSAVDVAVYANPSCRGFMGA